ncbi:hypothetical protein MLD38_010541 [Melastoma candidum]|uniref:Uncharacterized protein n=1 Tax=Melastoma candidum TaxID=119954 RepID=A0ACB9R084_9MYRT|nr:hypothetical protein MLD38_010541 [Melastoma candidum]
MGEDFFRPRAQNCIRRRRVHVTTPNENMAMATYVQPRVKGRRPAPTNNGWNDPEVKRQRRVVKYNMYAVEGKCKDSLKHGFRWLKHNFSRIVRGC